MVYAQSTATISGTIRCGSGCSAVGLNYGDPIQSGGSVVAHMTTALDPITGSPRPDLPTMDTNTTIDVHGHYELSVTPGVFDLYVSANGYQMTLFASSVVVLTGQSLSYDAYVTVTSTSTVTSTTTEIPIPGIPGFPIEAILVGFIVGIIGLALIRRSRYRGSSS